MMFTPLILVDGERTRDRHILGRHRLGNLALAREGVALLSGSSLLNE